MVLRVPMSPSLAWQDGMGTVADPRGMHFTVWYGMSAYASLSASRRNGQNSVTFMNAQPDLVLTSE
jgi:hypothetical protein